MTEPPRCDVCGRLESELFSHQLDGSAALETNADGLWICRDCRPKLITAPVGQGDDADCLVDQVRALVGKSAGAICFTLDLPYRPPYRSIIDAASRIAYDQDRYMSTWSFVTQWLDGSTVWRDLGNYAAAREHIERSLAIVRVIGNKQNEASSLNNLGTVYHEEAKYAAARAHHEQALAITRAIGDRERTGSTLTYLGMNLARLGDLDGAEAAYREASTIHRELDQVAQNITDLAGLGQVALARGQVEEAK